MGKFKYIFLFICIFYLFAQAEAVDGPASKGKQDDDHVEDFKGTKFLQVERIYVPNELKKIEEQIRQNILDVILITNTHTPIYTQKKEGYTDSYKKFFGLNVQISPVAGESDSYLVHFFYFNWTANKFDKNLFKKISKFNVVNEVRFGMYELLLGKDYVKSNRDLIDVQNYERIQAVRKSIEEQEKLEKKKSKKKQISSKQNDEEDDNASKKKNKLNRVEKEKKLSALDPVDLGSSDVEELQQDMSPEDPSPEQPDFEKITSGKTSEEAKSRKNLRKTSEKKETKKENERQDIVPLESSPAPDAIALGDSTKYRIDLRGLLGPLLEFTHSETSDKKISTDTNLKYLGIGGYIDFIQERPRPLGYSVSLKFGVPLIKENYELPVYRSAQVDIVKYDFLFSGSRISAGLEYSPTTFVNVPSFGGRLQVFENDFVWLRLRAGKSFLIKNHEIGLFPTIYVGLVSSSNQKVNLKGSKWGLESTYQMSNKLGLAALFQTVSLAGDLSASSSVLQLLISYKFEN